MIRKIFAVAVLFLCAGLVESAAVGGKVSPDGKQEIQVDLPFSQQMKNIGGSDGAGLCVFTSITHAARWQRVELLENWQQWMKRYPGGGYPQKVDAKIAQIAKEKGLPVPLYLQIEGGAEVLDVLRAAMASGRMTSVTYSFSPTGRYSGKRVAHMVNLAHCTSEWCAVLDNNYITPAEAAYEWMTPAEFLRTFTGGSSGWAVVLLSPGPQPLPWN